MNWLYAAFGAIAGWLASHASVAAAAQSAPPAIANPPDVVQGLNTVTIGTYLAPALIGFVYVLLGLVGVGLLGFLIWAFMQVFAEKRPGKEV